jgi:hypothetical protein
MMASGEGWRNESSEWSESSNVYVYSIQRPIHDVKVIAKNPKSYPKASFHRLRIKPLFYAIESLPAFQPYPGPFPSDLAVPPILLSGFHQVLDPNLQGLNTWFIPPECYVTPVSRLGVHSLC